MQTIRAGEGIIASNQSANRDADIFPDPDVFNLHRDFGGHDALGFGFGPHRCVAELLAVAELEAVFGEFLEDRVEYWHHANFVRRLVQETAEPEGCNST